jgi:c-di-GMP-binding flagellar brake protein YcgR
MVEGTEVGGRRHQRVRYQAGSIAVRNKASEPFLPGVLLDISISGCLLSVPSNFTTSPGQVIYMRLDLQSLVFSVLGFVRHADKGGSVLGVEFHRMSEKDKTELSNFVDYFAEE